MMTTKVTWTEVTSITNAAAAKLWIQALHDNLIACGLVQTNDINQLDPTMISAIPATGSYFGYLIYQFNDTLASEKPVLIKIAPYVGSFGGSATGSVEFTVGHVTDGLGNFMGANTSSFNYFNNTGGSAANKDSAKTPCYVIHGEGYFALCLHNGSIYNSGRRMALGFLSITRTLDQSGNATTDGVIVRRNGSAYNNTTVKGPADLIVAKMLLTSTPLGWNQRLTPFVGGADAASAEGRLQVQRTYILTPEVAADAALVMYWGDTIPTASEFSLLVDGVTRQYKALGNSVGMVADSANADGVNFAMLWDDL